MPQILHYSIGRLGISHCEWTVDQDERPIPRVNVWKLFLLHFSFYYVLKLSLVVLRVYLLLRWVYLKRGCDAVKIPLKLTLHNTIQ